MNTRFAPLWLPLLLFLPLPASAQIRASELARIEQTVDGTKLSLDYSRPRMRGRDASLFGEQVSWDTTWTPGANWATKFQANRDVRVNGHALPAGTYSVWFRLREQGAWTVAFMADSARSHALKPPVDSAVLHFDVQPQHTAHVETLTWSFTDYTHDGATLEFSWGRFRLPLHIVVTPTQRLHTQQDEAARVVGSYTMEWTVMRNQPAKAGSFEVTYSPADSTLHAKAVFPDQDPWHFVLAPRADGIFAGIFMNNGQYWSAADSYIFEFDADAEPSPTVQLRIASNDRLIGSGRIEPESP